MHLQDRAKMISSMMNLQMMILISAKEMKQNKKNLKRMNKRKIMRTNRMKTICRMISWNKMNKTFDFL